MNAFKQESFIKAMSLTSDRLIRCGHDFKNYSLTLQENGLKYIDLTPSSEIPSDLYYTLNRPRSAFGDLKYDDDKTDFIKWLINNRYYTEAILEINREYYRKEIGSAELLNNLMIALTATDRMEDALFEFEKRATRENRKDEELLYRVAYVNFELGNIEKVIADLETLSHKEKLDSIFKGKVYSLLSIAYAEKSDWQKVAQINTELKSYGFWEAQAEKNLLTAQDASTCKKKKPVIAGILSAIIPGLGYAYAGHPQTGLSALFVNGLLGAATYYSIRTENYGMAALTGVFNLAFYLGNVSGSSKSAKRYNAERNREFSRKIKNQSFF